MKKETNGQSADIQLNRPPLSLTQTTPFLKKERELKIDNRVVQRQIALLFLSWNFSYNPLYSFNKSKILIFRHFGPMLPVELHTKSLVLSKVPNS